LGPQASLRLMLVVTFHPRSEPRDAPTGSIEVAEPICVEGLEDSLATFRDHLQLFSRAARPIASAPEEPVTSASPTDGPRHAAAPCVLRRSKPWRSARGDAS
jgi:hypothetical protein